LGGRQGRQITVVEVAQLLVEVVVAIFYQLASSEKHSPFLLVDFSFCNVLVPIVVSLVAVAILVDSDYNLTVVVVAALLHPKFS
jgi:hypothetical protein